MAKRKRNADFDEETVAREMSAAVDEDIEEHDVDEEDFFGETSFKVDDERYIVFEDEDNAHDAAIAYVTEMLEQEPEMFTHDWLMGHINEQRLKDWVHSAVSEDEYAHDIASDDPDRFWEEAERWGVTIPDEEEREDKDPKDYADELTEAIAKDRAKDPMGFLNEIYGDGEDMKKAMDIAGIDIAGAADDAVSTDGWAHFLSGYDGNYDTTKSGFVYFKGSGYGTRRNNPAPSDRKLKAKLLR